MQTTPESLTFSVFISITLAAVAVAQAQEPRADTRLSEQLPEIVITAPKLELGLLALPASATVADANFLKDAAVRTVKDAAAYAPNTFFSEFSARALSNPRFRGIGGSPANPAVTTYFDGVPQSNAYSSSITLLDVEQVDFVRGPVGALYGRNSVGGLIHVASRKPALDITEGEVESTYGNYNLFEARGRVSMPLVKDTLALSVAGGTSQRDGYTKNTLNGHDLDSRSGWFGKTQLLWQVDPDLEVRLLLGGETDHDGDYALRDLTSLRANARQAQRDYEGFTHRDVFNSTLQVLKKGQSVDFTSTTGFVWWKAQDRTDLDYTAGPFNIPALGLSYLGDSTSYKIRDNRSNQSTFTQEFKVSNPTKAPIELSDQASLSWMAGIAGFIQNYDQSVSESTGALHLPTGAPYFGSIVAGGISTSNAGQRDVGVGAFIQPTLNLWKKFDLSAGVRWDYESKEADLSTNGTPEHLNRDFQRVTPQASLSYEMCKAAKGYFAFSSGYKAGGFNPAAVGHSSYGEERSQNYEIGLKGKSLGGGFQYQAALFYVNWSDLQLNVPTGRASYYISNAGGAASQGAEVSMQLRVVRGLDVFGSAGVQEARFLSNSVDSGASVSGKKLPNTPAHTAAIGTQFSAEVHGGWTAYARAELQNTGGFVYDSSNLERQDSYTLANFRLGVRNERVFVEGYANNAFNEKYIPIAIPFGGSYIGESGAPATFGVRAGIKF